MHATRAVSTTVRKVKEMYAKSRSRELEKLDEEGDKLREDNKRDSSQLKPQ